MGTALQDVRKEIERAKADAEADRRARTVVVTAADLLQEFQDAAAADRKYQGKYLEVSGVVDRAGTDGGNTPFVVLHGGDEDAPLKIECFFAPTGPADAARIRGLDKGQAIKVRGEYSGRVSHVQVRDCVLVK
jgi:hypothetical protein